MQQDYINCVDCSGGYFFLYLGSQLYQSFDSGLNLLTWQAAQTALHQKQKRSEKKRNNKSLLVLLMLGRNPGTVDGRNPAPVDR